MIKLGKIFFGILSFFTFNNYEVFADVNEQQLRDDLFQNYNKYVRPVNDYSQPLNVTIGLESKIE